MIGPEVLEWIRQQLEQGYTRDQLYSALVQQGHDPKEAMQAINAPKPVGQGMPVLPIAIIGFFVVAFAGLGGFLFFAGSDNETVIGAAEFQPELPDVEDIGCIGFPDTLETCEVYSCTFTEDGKSLNRQIIGYDPEDCYVIEEQVDDTLLECYYPDDFRMAVAQYYRTGEGPYTIDGETIDDPLQEALDTGVCFTANFDEPA